MNLEEELICLLRKAKEADEYFNPHLLTAIVDGIRDTHPDEDDPIPDEISDWIQDMWSR